MPPLPSFLWQVALHSSIMGIVFYAWARRVDLASGRTKRLLLALLLLLPVLTAAVPGRAGLEFRERLAWLDSGRLLAVPLPAGLRVYHVVLLAGLMMVGLTVWQELLPALRRPRTSPAAVPERLAQLARSLPGWQRCEVVLSPSEDIALATGGWPGRPRVIVSRGALGQMSEDELAIVLRHENAHWRRGRWVRAHALFLVRLLQCYNPVALWSFREYCLEVEIECDAEAVAGRDPRLLTRTLLRIYESTDRRDLAARAALRKRVDVLLGGSRRDDALPVATIALAAAILLAVLPWCV
ncbi:MAG: M48 family metalloprotease [Candidatus Rokubacteria bacterium]|nr:M48 family metalloprotease [Candidatus Rokubacteria bacterium]